MEKTCVPVELERTRTPSLFFVNYCYSSDTSHSRRGSAVSPELFLSIHAQRVPPSQWRRVHETSVAHCDQTLSEQGLCSLRGVCCILLQNATGPHLDAQIDPKRIDSAENMTKHINNTIGASQCTPFPPHA